MKNVHISRSKDQIDRHWDRLCCCEIDHIDVEITLFIRFVLYKAVSVLCIWRSLLDSLRFASIFQSGMGLKQVCSSHLHIFEIKDSE